jgi:hypothetical protein
MSGNVRSGCSSPKNQKPRLLYPMTHIQAPSMSHTIQTLILPLAGHIDLPEHTALVVCMISTSSTIITRRRVTMPRHSVRTIIPFYNGPLRVLAPTEAYSSQASTSRQKGTPYFEQKCASTLTDFHTNSQGFTTTLRRIDAYNGRAHYDGYPVETLLKKFIDLHKDFLRDVTELIKCYPFLGPLLGPSTSPLLLLLGLHLFY